MAVITWIESSPTSSIMPDTSGKDIIPNSSGKVVTSAVPWDEAWLGAISVNGAAVFNESGGNSDFRVEGTSISNLILVDADANKVVIGGTVEGTGGSRRTRRAPLLA
ncbi:MAG: hypothetical protein HRF49_03340 [bacterium]|jgi:hypothetical protein